MALYSDPARKQPSQENLLLEYVRRLDQHKEGRGAVHLHLSGLRSFNRREHHLRVAANSFEKTIKALQGQLFILKNADFFFVFKNEAKAEIETAVQRIRFLFSDDPLVVEEDNETRFATWYDVATQFDDIHRLVQGLVSAEERRRTESKPQNDIRSQLRARQQLGDPLTPEILDRVETALTRADLSNLVRRQFICRVNAKNTPEQVFSELFISIKDLRETLLPGVNLTANRWLFQHLTRTLDRRMLSMLAKTDHITISGQISFNLNVGTLLSQEFLNFDDNIPASRRGAMVVELQVPDVFADLGAYLFAREFVQERGYRVCIDGLTHESLDIIDRERLGADLVKLLWHSDLVDRGPDMQRDVRAMIRRTGEDRVVLCRCDNREALDFGRSVGISLFQGRHVESLIAEEDRRRELRRLRARIDNS
jgi:hypothetical protein